MSFLVDTNVLSEAARPRPDPMVVAWLDDHELDLYLSVITIGEFRRGISLQQSEKKAASLQAWLDGLVENFEERILPIDQKVALKWGEYYAGRQKLGQKPPATDSLLAATALVHSLTVATRNDMDFPGVPVFNPFLRRDGTATNTRS